jgi:hypothetical protein
MAVVIVLALITFLAGATVGIIVVVSAGIRREEQRFSLTRAAPSRTSQGARLLTGLYVRRRTDADSTRDQREDVYA